MTSTRILVLEHEQPQSPTCASALEKRGYSVLVECQPGDALQRVQSYSPDLIVLNAASLKISGSRLCRQLRVRWASVPLLLLANSTHLPDPQCGASAVLVLPFTSRKMLNMVARLLPSNPADCLRVGPIQFDPVRRRVTCQSRQERLTPKQAKMLAMFMHSPGQLLTRKSIMRHVWDTDYMGDTRTLDVHISWLRRLIEPNPLKPRFLKTVHGQGYRLELLA